MTGKYRTKAEKRRLNDYASIVGHVCKELGSTITRSRDKILSKYRSDKTSFRADIPMAMSLEIITLKKKYGLSNIDFILLGLHAVKDRIKRLKGRSDTEFLSRLEEESDKLIKNAEALSAPAVKRRRFKY